MYRASVIVFISTNQCTNIYMIKCTLVQALRLCTGCMSHKGSRGIALLFLDHSTKRGWGVSVTPRPLFAPGKDPVPIVQEAAWAPGPVWTSVENLAPTGIRTPDRPARSQSLQIYITYKISLSNLCKYHYLKRHCVICSEAYKFFHWFFKIKNQSNLKCCV